MKNTLFTSCFKIIGCNCGSLLKSNYVGSLLTLDLNDGVRNSCGPRSKCKGGRSHPSLETSPWQTVHRSNTLGLLVVGFSFWLSSLLLSQQPSLSSPLSTLSFTLFEMVTGTNCVTVVSRSNASWPANCLWSLFMWHFNDMNESHTNSVYGQAVWFHVWKLRKQFRASAYMGFSLTAKDWRISLWLRAGPQDIELRIVF